MNIDKQKQKIGERYQLPPLLAERLRGETSEELERDAKFLARHLAPEASEFIAPLKDLESLKSKDPWIEVAQGLAGRPY